MAAVGLDHEQADEEAGRGDGEEEGEPEGGEHQGPEGKEGDGGDEELEDAARGVGVAVADEALQPARVVERRGGGRVGAARAMRTSPWPRARAGCY